MWLKKLCILSLFLLWLPAAGFCTDTTTASDNQTVTLSIAQYNKLSQIISQQELTLDQLQTKLNLLSQNSTVQQQTLTTLNSQLTACKQTIVTTKQSLTSATTSLQAAEITLQQQEKSLEMLQGQVKALEHHAVVLQRQRDTWAVGYGVLVCVVIHDKT